MGTGRIQNSGGKGSYRVYVIQTLTLQMEPLFPSVILTHTLDYILHFRLRFKI